MNVLQHTRNEVNLCLKKNRPDRSNRDTLLIFFLLLVKVELSPERHYLKDSTRAFGRLIDFDPITPEEK